MARVRTALQRMIDDADLSMQVIQEFLDAMELDEGPSLDDYTTAMVTVTRLGASIAQAWQMYEAQQEGS